MTGSMHDVSDPRNASVLINVNGELKARNEAVVSVFDSGFMLGDGVWEGLRVHEGKLGFLDRHLDRLFEGAKAIAMDPGLSRDELVKRLYDTLDANGMSEGVHVRLMVTRGVRATPYQDPRVVVGGATIVIIPEYKEPDPAVYERGLKLLHGACAPRRSGGAGPENQLAFKAQLHPRLDPGHAGGGGRGVDARPARLRRDLQLHALFHHPQGRAVDLERQILPLAGSPAPWCWRSLATPAFRRLKRTSRSPMSTARTRRSSPAHLPASSPFARSMDVSSPAAAPMVHRLQKLYAERIERDVAGAAASVTGPHRHVVWSQKPFHGDDAQLRQPGRHICLR